MATHKFPPRGSMVGGELKKGEKEPREKGWPPKAGRKKR